nr:site-specific integrase [Lachnospiraceae bacterium]
TEGLIPYNPVSEAVINKKLMQEYSKDDDLDDDFLTYEEVRIFLGIVEEHPLYEVFYTTLFFGLRREEMLGLKWSAIDFKNKTIKINHTVTKGTTVNRLNSTKTEASKRDYPLTDEQINMFRHIKKQESDNRKLFGNCYIENNYIFKHEDGTPYYPDYPSKELHKIIVNNPNLPQNTNFRSLRRSCVSILVHEGMDIKSIQKWVGHKDLDTTLRIYAKVKDKEAKMVISTGLNDVIKLKQYDDD